jgi:superfamily I DNA/RNA helicase
VNWRAGRAPALSWWTSQFQDVNFAQVKVLQKLAGAERNVFAVGDPDQAIYRFRGASSAAFVLFQRHFPGGKLIKLEKNRRSLSPILHSAFAHISKNPNVFDAGRDSTAYQRSVLASAREEDAARLGRTAARRWKPSLDSKGHGIRAR